MVVDNIIASEDNTYYHIENTDKWYVNGFTYYCCCGIDLDNNIIFEPRQIPFKGIEKIRTNDRRSFFITSDHELFVNGENHHGELGIGDYSCAQLDMVLVDNVFDVYPMDYRTYIQTIDNKFYVCGVYESDFSKSFDYPHEINLDEEMAKYKYTFPIRLPSGGWKVYNPPKNLPEDIKEVVSSDDKFFYLTNNGRLFYSGEGVASGFGIKVTGDPVINILDAREFPMQNVKMVKVGVNHTAILTEDGKLYVCGRNSKGKLGLGFDVEYTYGGVSKLAEDVTFVEVGDDRTFYALKSGKIMYCGKGDYDELETYNPKQLPWFTFSTKVNTVHIPQKKRVDYTYQGILHRLIIIYELHECDKIIMSSYIETPSLNKITKIKEDIMFYFSTSNMDDTYNDLETVSNIRIEDLKTYVRTHTNYYEIPKIKNKTIIKLSNGSLIEVEGTKTKEECINITKNYVYKKYNTIYDKTAHYNEIDYDNLVDGNPVWKPECTNIISLSETNKSTYNTY